MMDIFQISNGIILRPWIIHEIAKVNNIKLWCDLDNNKKKEILYKSFDDCENDYFSVIILDFEPNEDKKKNLPPLLIFKKIYDDTYNDTNDNKINYSCIKHNENRHVKYNERITYVINLSTFKQTHKKTDLNPFSSELIEIIHNETIMNRSIDKLHYESSLNNEITYSNENNMMIFDTETTEYSGDIVQIGIIIASSTYEIMNKFQFTINPDNKFIITNSHIHGITHQYATKYGKKINDVLLFMCKLFKYIDTIICHNADFDVKHIINSILKHEIHDGNKYINQILSKTIICTSYNGAKLLESPKSTKIALDILYEKLHNKKYKQKHTGLDDSEVCFKCYTKLIENNLIDSCRKLCILNDKIKATKCLL